MGWGGEGGTKTLLFCCNAVCGDVVQAAMYGAACWAQDVGEGLPGVAVIASGIVPFSKHHQPRDS